MGPRLWIEVTPVFTSLSNYIHPTTRYPFFNALFHILGLSIDSEPQTVKLQLINYRRYNQDIKLNMGNYLSYPSLKKHAEDGKNQKFLYALCEMQGWRLVRHKRNIDGTRVGVTDMEDAHAAVLDLDGNEESTNAFFAVYDGHGGFNCAKHSGPNVHRKLITQDAYKSGEYREALRRTFIEFDEEMKSLTGNDAIGASGCTAVTALVTKDNRVFVANAGDSRAVISSGGLSKALSNDHKPGDPAETKRITEAQGFVRFGRVNGNIALSRAFGDFEYKKNETLSPEAQIITCDPEIIEHAISADDEFLIIACDGIWDCLSSQAAVDSVRLLLSQGYKLPEVCERLLDHLVAPDTDSDSPVGCDNMTVLVVALLNGKTEDEWYAWVSERAKQNTNFERLPQLYADYRLSRFEKRKEIMAERERQRQGDSTGSGTLTPTQVSETAAESGTSFLAQPELTPPASA
ncbi:phosphatase 2C-domain-containing protein [Cristinia sonorae]|uniref:protein-serine/threonine phosphatase n=1 Tax=Cristinia sonorae TaxID=1940300 RepID=A0A8K0UF00_9AGAR|nr:phosphatase 2C-domain-containing protein [Cristinia sonorae]